MVEARDDDRGAWRELHAVTGANGGRDDLFLPESEARQLRLRALACAGTAAIAEITLRPLDWSSTREAFVTNLAHDARRGLYPRGFVPEQVYWTVVGADRDTREGLLSEDGALEAGPGGFSLEPFLWTGGRLVTWADVTAEASLAQRSLPLPRVTWTSDPWRLEVQVDPVGEPGASSLRATYALTNTGARPDSATLYLAVRPFQVNPPSQFLNLRGGTSPIGALARDGHSILVDGKPRVILGAQPAAFGATTFAGGDVVADHLEHGLIPAANAVDDPFGAASAAASYPFALGAGQTATVEVLLPLYETAAYDTTADPATAWREKLDRVTLIGPPAAAEAFATVKAQLGYILVNRAGPAVQPGTRSYARSWIRDGALTGEALLRLGHAEAAVDFLAWFAPHQYENGKIPCVVDWRGADPVPEHDSTGEFIHLVCECYRYTGDRELLDADVAARRGRHRLPREPARRAPHRRVPRHRVLRHPAALHQPRGLLGQAHALLLGRLLGPARLQGRRVPGGRTGRARGCRARRRARPLRRRPRRVHRRGDAAPRHRLRAGLRRPRRLRRDLDHHRARARRRPATCRRPARSSARSRGTGSIFAARRAGAPWDALTPYELRNLGAFVRLGWRDRANEHLAWFLEQRRPAGWRHWAEVVWRDERAARFIGDMPHTWVGSDYIRSVLDMLCYEDRASEALVLAAGVPEAWLAQGGLTVRDLPTPYGVLSYTLRREDKAVVMDLVGDVRIPKGGLVLRPPVDDRRAKLGGKTVPAGQDVVVRTLPLHVEWGSP